MNDTSIIISADDYKIVLEVLDRASFVDPVQQKCLEKLLFELERAEIKSVDAMPDTVVRLGSVVDIETPFGMKDGLTLVVPEEGDFSRKKLSIISPMGSALLGYAQGQTVHWPLRNGVQTIVISKVRND